MPKKQNPCESPVDITDMFSDFQTKFGWVKCDNPAFQKALYALLNTNDNLCIMGSAGAGKTTLLNIAYSILPEQSKLIVASTGVAAANISQNGIPATTLHSAFQIPPREWYNKVRIKKCTLKVAESTDLLLLDEVSMINANLCDYLLEAIRKGNKKRKALGKQPVRIIFFGDVLQLPPVIKKDSDIWNLFEEEYEGKTFFYRAKLFSDFFGPNSQHNLYHAYRQDETQQDFVKALDEVRTGSVSDGSLELLNQHVTPLEDFAAAHDDFLYLVSTNKVCENFNKKYEEKFAGKPSRTYTASYSKLDASSFPTVPQSVTIYEGMRVISLANDPEHQYSNGSFGRCVGFDEDNNPIVAFKNGNTASVKTAVWSNYNYHIEDNIVKPSLAGSCEQMALRPAFAVTYHKSQSMTLDNVYLAISGWMAPSSIYIGLSRIRNINGLGLNRPLKKSDIVLEQEALDYLSGEWKNPINKETEEQDLPF